MDSLTIGGKNHISSKRAAELMGYTQDYIGQLARAGKIDAKRVSGVWYISEDEFSGNDTDQSNNTDIGETNTADRVAGGKTNSGNVKDESETIILEGDKYISSKRAAELMGYTQDYIGQLCRAGKIEARQVGRSWYVPMTRIEGEQEILQTPTREVNNEEEAPFREPTLEHTPVTNKGADILIQSAYTYTNDEKPLIPTPQRVSRPLLHEILAEERDSGVLQTVDRDTYHTEDSLEPTPSRVHGVIPAQETKIKKTESNPVATPSRLSTILRVGTVAAMIVFSSLSFSYAPYKTAYSTRGVVEGDQVEVAIQADVLQAGVGRVGVRSSFLEKGIDFLLKTFGSELEYKAK
ncbi:MAG: helix-turn-helix domain-containing protein [Candidatus Pacebacteria bacterium]|nr:helix-turn-helix domain-containing protein [Candidatus Paceibacterota bacterium]